MTLHLQPTDVARQPAHGPTPDLGGRISVERPELGARFLRLEVVGDAELVRRGRGIAIVGARAATVDSMRWARALAEALGQKGEVVVSGGAIGIDGAAHEGALAGGGRTVVALGTGVDVTYPLRHGPLFSRVVSEGGALVSPFPAGTAVRRHNFPVRNPLIAALSRAVVVIEASARSGSLGTATAARALGLPLLVRAGSAGCDVLLGRGAVAVATVDDALAVLAGRTPLVQPTTPLLGALAMPRTVDALAEMTGATHDELLITLLELEAAGRIIRLADGRCLAIRVGADTKE